MGNPLYPAKHSRSHAAAAAAASSSSASSSSSFVPGLRGGSFAASTSKYAKPANEYDPSFHPGLLNLGNTCFLNSVLQAIANTRDFRLLIQGPPASAAYSEDKSPPSSSPHTAAAAALLSARHTQWPNRSQSPALRVSDGEHGRRIHHTPSPSTSLDSSLASLNTLPAHDPIATIKPGRLPLPPATTAVPPQHNNSATPAYEPDVHDLPLNTAFRHVLEKFWTDGHKSRASVNVNPKRLLNQIGKKYDQYLEYGQQDGHELMRHLLDACRMEELDVIKKMRPPPPNKKAKIDQHASTSASTSAAAAARLTPADMENGQIVSHPTQTVQPPSPTAEQLLPFLDLLFCGKLASMVVCEACKNVSHTYEDFYDISLSLRDDASNPKSRKRDRLRSMADRWRKATQGRTIVDRKSAAAATAAAAAAATNSPTPVGTPRYSATEASDADSNALKPKKSAGFLSPDEGGRGRFQLRTRSLRRSSGRHEKLGATSGSEMEPDFPDMASLSLAPTSAASRPYVDSAPASAGEDNGDARTGTRVARMLGSATNAADASSRETSPNPPIGGRMAPPPFAAGMRPPIRTAKSSSHQSAYIARIMADDPTSSHADPAAPRKAGAPSPLFDAVAAAAAAQGKPMHGFFRSVGAGARTRDPAAELEPNPKSQGAKRRHKMREEQSTTGLVASLRQFTSVEVLDGDNSFACKNCWRLANPPNAQEREQIRRRRRRKGVAAAEVDDDEGSEPSSSDGESDREQQKSTETRSSSDAVSDETLVAQPMSTSTSQSTLASSSVDSIMTGSSASHPSQQRSDVPTISMTSVDASTDELKTQQPLSGSLGEGDVVARDYAASATPSMSSSNGSNGVAMQQKRGSESSLSSVEAAAKNRDRLAPSNGYDTGTETDMSGFSTGLDESNASTGEGTDTEAEGDGAKKKLAGAERSGPKRSAQSLPRRALKRYLIASAPPVLIFHLKRFQATGRGFVSGLAGFKKIDDQVTFPEYLDITPWLAPPREEYDRRGRLKASSDPLAIRRRAEEEAIHAGVDARRVKVEVSHERGGRGHRKGLHGPDGKGKKHGMWSWHLSGDHRGAGGAHGGRAAVEGGNGDLDEGPKVHSSTGHEIVPSVIRRPKTEYRLYAVIVHQGSLSAGHYTAYVLSDRIKLKDGVKEMVARSAPTSRTNTPAPLSGNAAAAAVANGGGGGRGGGGGFGQFFLGGRPSRSNAASPAPVPIRPASAAPASTSSVAMKSMPSSSSVSGSSSHDIAPQTSISSLDTDGSQRSVTSESEASQGGPKLVRPHPQLKPMASWDSLDELEQTHAQSSAANGSATPTTASASTPLEPTPAVATVASHNSNAHRHVEDGVGGEDDDVDPRKRDDGRRWVYTSDTVVRAATIDEVLRAKAYMLFYERL
ncbi:conserved hypothetical protein [Sporisorium reilianum SRZ2]|uniref:ubiquitinyl hydrolase 1 n=1 Tax=Sporisorium reilianum (strain SRZ2) TaxID=999809 RepID=E6ZSP5_SPORE|nr:conserved hypothetical protein [Sporisorium reilianum SRZ2]